MTCELRGSVTLSACPSGQNQERNTHEFGCSKFERCISPDVAEGFPDAVIGKSEFVVDECSDHCSQGCGGNLVVECQGSGYAESSHCPAEEDSLGFVYTTSGDRAPCFVDDVLIVTSSLVGNVEHELVKI